MNIFLSPSLLSADFTRVGEQLSLLEEAGVPYLHLDVMDGIFVPNISFGMPVIQSIRKASKMVFDVHLMITEPERYAEEFAKAGADIVNFHVEATRDPAAVLAKIKKTGAKAGITIKPGTPVETIKPYLPDVDMVLVMTVEPGFAGQKFMPEQVEKSAALRNGKRNLGLRMISRWTAALRWKMCGHLWTQARISLSRVQLCWARQILRGLRESF